MAGHSKWANIKHRKAKGDAKRGQVFTKISRRITLAVKEGGSDPEANFKLRLAIDNARSVNMPNDNIERAIQKGSGGLDGANYEDVIYEGYGPYGVAILMEVLTDNRNRTVGELRHRLSKNGGSLGESNCVAWMFETKGLLVIERDPALDDDVMLDALDAGALDVIFEEEMGRILTTPVEFEEVKEKLEGMGYVFVEALVSKIAQNEVELTEEQALLIEKLTDALEELDDVQAVYTNEK